jgi:hypothetical protein
VTDTEALSLIGATLVALVWVILRWQERRTTRVPAAVPAPVAPAVRAELEVTTTWWTGRFHQLLESVGAESVVGERIETRTWAGELAAVWEDRGWRDCPCPKCRRICA